MTTPQPPVDALDQKLTELGNAFIRPLHLKKSGDAVALPPDFFHRRPNNGSTVGMTNGAKSRVFRERAFYSTLRSTAYEKVLAACLARSNVARSLAFVFVLVWGGTMLTFNWSRMGEVQTALVNTVAKLPGLGGLATLAGTPGGNGAPGAAMTPQQAELQRLQRELYGQ